MLNKKCINLDVINSRDGASVVALKFLRFDERERRRLVRDLDLDRRFFDFELRFLDRFLRLCCTLREPLIFTL